MIFSSHDPSVFRNAMRNPNQHNAYSATAAQKVTAPTPNPSFRRKPESSAQSNPKHLTRDTSQLFTTWILAFARMTSGDDSLGVLAANCFFLLNTTHLIATTQIVICFHQQLLEGFRHANFFADHARAVTLQPKTIGRMTAAGDDDDEVLRL